jgi:hypothetical protein
MCNSPRDLLPRTIYALVKNDAVRSAMLVQFELRFEGDPTSLQNIRTLGKWLGEPDPEKITNLLRVIVWFREEVLPHWE